MRLAILLLVGSAVFANPFYKGASWEWEIDDPTDTLPGHRVLQVIDSSQISPDDDTKFLTLRVADSLADPKWDTMRLAEGWEGDASNAYFWLKGSSRFPVEPRPFVVFFDLENEYRELWGMEWHKGNDTVWYEYPGSVVVDSHLIRINSIRSPSLFAWLPNLDWSSDSGWKNFWWYREDRYGPNALVAWRLIAKDGKPLANARISKQGISLVPSVGAVRVWEVNDSGHTTRWYTMNTGFLNFESSIWDEDKTIRWEFQERPNDSVGWKRATIRETVVSEKGNEVSTFFVRWGMEGEVVLSSSSDVRKILASGFWVGKNSLPVKGGWSTALYGGYHFEGGFNDCRNGFVTKSGTDWYVQDSWNTSGNAGNSGGGNHYYYNLRLLQVDDSVIRQPTTASIQSARSHGSTGLGDLRELALSYPAATVRVRGVKGSTQTLRLDQFVQRRPTHGLGLRWVEVRLPDGS
ncbi:MAG: hypothetical protein AAB214_14530, partial [Fibrobacterota bacterium]